MTKLVLTEENTGWFFCFDQEAISIADNIGLPKWSSDTHNAVCMPISMRDKYDRLCLDNGVSLVWKKRE